MKVAPEFIDAAGQYALLSALEAPFVDRGDRAGVP